MIGKPTQSKILPLPYSRGVTRHLCRARQFGQRSIFMLRRFVALLSFFIIASAVEKPRAASGWRPVTPQELRMTAADIGDTEADGEQPLFGDVVRYELLCRRHYASGELK